MPASPAQITHLLEELTGGDRSAADQLLPLVYDELKSLARRHLARQRADHTLQPTALVHEAFMKLARHRDAEWTGKSHFYAVAARAMRQILMDHARDRKAAKRGGGERERVTLDAAVAPAGTSDRGVDLLALDEALTALAELSERKARVVELRFFSELTVRETAEVLDIGVTTVEEDWRFARAWLARELGKGGSS